MNEVGKNNRGRGGRSFTGLPAIRALGMQILSLLLVYGVAVALAQLAGLALPFYLLVLIQGLAAAGLSRWFGLASWWLLIQFAFVPLLYLAALLELPPALYLCGFLFLLVLYWSTYRTQVPYYPSGPSGWQAVAAVLPQSPLAIIDIGCGFGGMVRYLARARPDCKVAGVELAPLPFLLARVLGIFTASKGQIFHGDYQRYDFSKYDIVFAYLSPAAMPALWEKVQREMRPGSLLLSYEFCIPGAESQITNISQGDDRVLHGWRM